MLALPGKSYLQRYLGIGLLGYNAEPMRSVFYFMPSSKNIMRALLTGCTLFLLLGCAVQPARQEDPWQAMNRKIFTFNEKVDTYVGKPISKTYLKVTTANTRLMISNFYSNIRLPISIVNDLMQVQLEGAAKNTGRLVVNTTIGLAGIFDPASELGLNLDQTDFGVTLAHWGVPQGPYMVLPILGPSSLRDVWAYPVDTYFLNPMSYWIRANRLNYGAEYLPLVLYYIQLRASYMDADAFLSSAYDPYILMRDAYLQRRNFLIYHGNPPSSLIEDQQGLGPGNSPVDVEAILARQQAWQKQHRAKGGPGKTSVPKPLKNAAKAPPRANPATPSSSTVPATASSVPVPAGF